MIIGMTLLQLRKIKILSQREVEKLAYLIKKGGVVNFSDDLESLRKFGLVKKIGGVAYINFYMNGKKPIENSGVSKKRSAGSEIFAYRRAWEKFGRVETTSMVMGLLKKFMASFSLPEFIRLVKTARYSGVIKNPESITKVWSRRAEFHVAEDNDPDAMFDSE